jgi:hypothetical protein
MARLFDLKLGLNETYLFGSLLGNRTIERYPSEIRGLESHFFFSPKLMWFPAGARLCKKYLY